MMNNDGARSYNDEQGKVGLSFNTTSSQALGEIAINKVTNMSGQNVWQIRRVIHSLNKTT